MGNIYRFFLNRKKLGHVLAREQMFKADQLVFFINFKSSYYFILNVYKIDSTVIVHL